MAMGKTTTWDANFVGIKKKASVLLPILSLIALVEMAGGCRLGYDSGEEYDEESGKFNSFSLRVAWRKFLTGDSKLFQLECVFWGWAAGPR